jgi:hypothetical protein
MRATASVTPAIFVNECLIKLTRYQIKWRIKRIDPTVVTTIWLIKSHRLGVVAPTTISHRPEIMPVINKTIAILPIWSISANDRLTNKVKNGINPIPIKMWIKTFEI